jgi:MYXO-CTERM domain-containing protein
MQAEISNNVIFGTGRASLVDDPSGIVVGASNWMPTGAAVGPLVDTVFGTDPGFKNAAQNDFTLNALSAAIGKASSIPKFLPVTEYFKDEVTARRYRVRATTRDIGAFESTTTDPSYGPYDPPPVPDAGPPPPDTDAGIPIPDPHGSSSGGIPDDAGPAGDGGNGAAPGGASSSGCGCRAGSGDGGAMAGAALLLLGLGAARRRAVRRRT